MVIEVEEVEPSTVAPPLTAVQYRRLWLDSAAELGQVAECLSHALGWQATDGQPLPNALALAGAAAERILALDRQLDAYRPKLKARRPAREYA